MERITGKYRIFFSIGIFFLLSVFQGYAQERKSLENEKKENIEKLKLTRSMLESTRRDYKSGTQRLNLVNRGLIYRESLIGNYDQELNLISEDILRQEKEIQNNKEELARIKEDYARIVRAGFHHINNEYWLMYVLSSQDINQAYQRIKYIRYLNQYRERLYENIIAVNDSISLRVDSLQQLRTTQETTMHKLEMEKSELLSEKNKKLQLVKELKSREQKLIEEIRNRERVQKRIENEIRKLIEEEARKAKEANRINSLTPQEKIIDENFSKNMGGLPWPTEQGIITGQYGVRKHEIMKNIEIRSNGIDISTPEDTKVRAVFKGEVTKVVAIMGVNYVVIIKHGNYRTIYQNLINVNVKAGDIIEMKEYIGEVGMTENDDYVMHFELWDKTNTNDPEKWLSK